MREQGLVTKDVAIEDKAIGNSPGIRSIGALLDIDMVFRTGYLGADEFRIVVDYTIAIWLPGGMLILG